MERVLKDDAIQENGERVWVVADLYGIASRRAMRGLLLFS